MRVENLIGKDFDEACQSLAKLAWDRLQPDLVIGVRRGGYYVMEAMRGWVEGRAAERGSAGVRPDDAAASAAARPPHFGATLLQRSGNQVRSRSSKLLKKLPPWLCNALRIAESRLLTCRLKCRPTRLTDPNQIQFDPDSQALLQSGPQRIWVVDDAVDSGKTLASIQQKLQSYPQSHQVLYLALTQTQGHPLLQPDCCLFHGVLLRFPWSNDNKKPRS